MNRLSSLSLRLWLALAALIGGGVLLLLGLWPVLFAPSNAPSPEKVNLALRRTADQLMRAAGDSTSRIAPVEQTGPYRWQVQLPGAFSYDRLPEILQMSLKIHNISYLYDVSITECVNKVIILGYSFQDILNTGSIPCTGRDLPKGCYSLQLSLHPPQSAGRSWIGWLGGGLLAVALLLLRRKKPTPPTLPADATDWMPIGASRFDARQGVLLCGNTEHKLTHREAKLLHLFARHPNEVLERSFIHDQVWADEGVVVSRSVDMFVSRLRKRLSDDPTVQLVAVHGVGYRMEVTTLP